MSTLENAKITRHMDRVITPTQMVQPKKVPGKMTCNMAKEKKNGKMVLSLSAITELGKKMVTANSIGLTYQATRVSLATIISKVMASTTGQTVDTT